MNKLTTTELERKRDKALKYLGYRNSAREALKFRAIYDKCVEELIRREFEGELK